MRNSKEIIVPILHSSIGTYRFLSDLNTKLSSDQSSTIIINFEEASWLDGNMCAPLGAILYKAQQHQKSLSLINISAHVSDFLRKNGFLIQYGLTQTSDRYHTTIQYQRFESKDELRFREYISKHLETKAIPHMLSPLKKKFLLSISELFNNAVYHSESKLGIFACGQYFPRKHSINFSIADLGIGIQKNLFIKKGLALPAIDAIKWAMEGTNTTKKGAIPGGLGLKLLREFILINNGWIQIASDNGFWELRNDGQVVNKILVHPFPGTVVNIMINTNDQSIYYLDNDEIVCF